jgi:hypothetical protein
MLVVRLIETPHSLGPLFQVYNCFTSAIRLGTNSKLVLSRGPKSTQMPHLYLTQDEYLSVIA